MVADQYCHEKTVKEDLFQSYLCEKTLETVKCNVTAAALKTATDTTSIVSQLKSGIKMLRNL